MSSRTSAVRSAGGETLPRRLKQETAAAHDLIEQVVDLDRISSSVGAYRDLLARFYGFHAAWEPLAETHAPDPAAFRARRKLPLLVSDLRALGLDDRDIRALPLCDRLMPTCSPWDVHGTMYVLEGATLGGAVIARTVERRLGLDATSGCSFFRCYSRDAAGMWRAFQTGLSAASGPEADEAIVTSANRTFECLTAWLSRA